MPRRKLASPDAFTPSSTVALAARGDDDKPQTLDITESLTATGPIDLSPSASNRCNPSGGGFCDAETGSRFEIADTASQMLAIGTLGNGSVSTVREGCRGSYSVLRPKRRGHPHAESRPRSASQAKLSRGATNSITRS
ncbi:MAG: hypothetical protein WA988_21365 [Candidatus Nanopelagicales bacterium]